MRVITWNKSFRGISNGEGGKDDFDSEEHETHASVLDKLLAWEKKLYEEVKVHCFFFLVSSVFSISTDCCLCAITVSYDSSRVSFSFELFSLPTEY